MSGCPPSFVRCDRLAEHSHRADVPTPEQQAALLEQYHAPLPVIAHGEAVAQYALELSRQMSCPVDTALLLAACRLHDIARTDPDHARAGAELLTREGFPALGVIVSQHHDLPVDAGTEACLLYLADKMIQGTQRVALAARFEQSRRKCRTPEALQAWRRRYERAIQVVEQLRLELSENEVFYE